MFILPNQKNVAYSFMTLIFNLFQKFYMYFQPWGRFGDRSNIVNISTLHKLIYIVSVILLVKRN